MNKTIKKSAVKEYGKADDFESEWNLHSQHCQKITSIIIYCGSIEYRLERAIWKCENIEPKGIQPDTDAKPITNLISRLEEFAKSPLEIEEQSIIKLWCDAARSGFTIRNNIAHGLALNIDGKLAFMRNPRWHGEERKRKFGDLWIDEYSMDLVCDSFAVLLRIIGKVEAGQPFSQIATPLAQRALREAQSILGEFSSQDYNPEFEKY